MLTSYVFTLLFSGRGALIHTGALMATMMTANVAMVIMPNQRKSIAALVAGETPDPKWGREAKQRSTHNNYITLPVLFMMLSNHYPVTYANARDHSGARHLRHHRRRADPLFLQYLARRPRQGAVVGLVRRGDRDLGGVLDRAWPARPACAPTLGLGASPPVRAAAADAPQGAGARSSRSSPARCSMCHAPEPVWEGIGEAPKGVLLDTPEHIAALRAGYPHAGRAHPCYAAQQSDRNDAGGARDPRALARRRKLARTERSEMNGRFARRAPR